MSIFSFLKKKNKETTQEFISRIPYNSEVDPVAEAAIYLAYGRIEQAKEILLEARLKEPERVEIQEMLDKLEEQKEDITNKSIIFKEPQAQSSLVQLESNSELLSEIPQKYKALINLMIKYPNSSETNPDNFEFACSCPVHTKEWHEQLRKEIEKRGYASWALLSIIELKE